ncbi:MAG: septal ring lytic transglycosylase RlpA family protein [Deltaproteobacteria bacterium]|nr:septal ring lytic transglycosylase RlpA family protein [Deltaproteobacteria bacterium]
MTLMAFLVSLSCAPSLGDSASRKSRSPNKDLHPIAALKYNITKVANASWYGMPFHGRRTANGEWYNMHALTAAHKSLPFDSLVKVTNLNNGKTVIVRINDRGPYAHNREIDLSYMAAKQLNMIGQGVAKVKLEILKSPEKFVYRQLPSYVYF